VGDWYSIRVAMQVPSTKRSVGRWHSTARPRSLGVYSQQGAFAESNESKAIHSSVGRTPTTTAAPLTMPPPL